MKTKKIIFVLIIASWCFAGVVIFAFTTLPAARVVTTNPNTPAPAMNNPARGCVFKTVFEGEFTDTSFLYKTPEKVITSVETGLEWISKAQHPDGGWGAGTHANQKEMNPHAVQPDPATTAMVSMALLRSGNTLTSGKYSAPLKKSLHYLLGEIEKSANNTSNITSLTGTQIQIKLGANIDVALTAQFLSNLLEQAGNDEATKARVKKCLDVCVKKIQNGQTANGSFKGSGWAGVLQSSFANNALESAQANGIAVDSVVLEKSREYQKGNFNSSTGAVNTDMGAGVVLYSVSSSTRASSKDARKVEEQFARAKKEGKLAKDAKVTTENLEKIGYNKTEAMKYNTSYNVYNSAKEVSQQDGVMSGFGNNGGEEFLSFLQTGESMIIGKDNDWKKWYEKVSGTLLTIQNQDGSWNGHHCITSPVFCTATSIMILTVNNDIDKLVAMGGK